MALDMHDIGKAIRVNTLLKKFFDFVQIFFQKT